MKMKTPKQAQKKIRKLNESIALFDGDPTVIVLGHHFSQKGIWRTI